MSHSTVRRVAVAGLAALALLASACDDEELPTSAGEPSPKPGSAAGAARFAPMVWLAEGDKNGPMDASRFVAGSDLLFQGWCGDLVDRQEIASDVDERKLGGRDDPYTTSECSTTASEPKVASDSYTGTPEVRGFYLDLENREELRRGDGPAAPVYWQYYDKGDGHTGAFVYWLFYGYNNFVNVHEGDWERVAVQVKDGEPDGLTFWKHEEGPCRVPWDDIDKRDGHPVTYSAVGSHGSYPWQGTYDASGVGAYQVVSDTTSQGTAWPTWEHARSVVEQPWWGYRGLWGDQTRLTGGDGPRGPHPDRQEAVFATKACEGPLPEPTASPGPSVPQDEPPQDGIPDAFRDTWEAAKPMTRPGLAKPYYVHLQLWHRDTPVTDDTAGTSSYSDRADFSAGPDEDGVSCSGDLTLVEASADKVVLTETEDHDANGNCPDTGTITLTLSGDTLVYDYTGGGGTAHAVLERS